MGQTRGVGSGDVGSLEPKIPGGMSAGQVLGEQARGRNTSGLRARLGGRRWV